MIQTGIVENVIGGKAYIRVKRETSCGENCAECGGTCGKTIIAEAENTLNAEAGDRVEINMSTAAVMSAAAVIYILPLIALAVGFIVGNRVFKSEGAGILSGFVLMAVSYAAAAVYGRKNKDKYRAVITKII